MSGTEVIAEAVKVALALGVAIAFGWVIGLWKKPSRAEFDALKARIEANERELHVQGTVLVELRTGIHSLTESLKDGLAQLRRDIRDLRGERGRDTDP